MVRNDGEWKEREKIKKDERGMDYMFGRRNLKRNKKTSLLSSVLTLQAFHLNITTTWKSWKCSSARRNYQQIIKNILFDRKEVATVKYLKKESTYH